MSPVYSLSRPFLFALDPEAAHRLTLSALEALRAAGALGLAAPGAVPDPVTVMGLRFANRVGLAAGLDKNAAHVDALGALGFGFIEVGTVTLHRITYDVAAEQAAIRAARLPELLATRLAEGR